MENPLTSPTGVPGFLLWLIGALLSGGGLGLWAGRRKRAADAASVNAETAIKLLTAIEANYEILHVRYSEEVERNKRLAAENHQLAAAQVDFDVLTLHVDGKMDALLAATSATARAQGVAEGRQLGSDERQVRVAESERVEDRVVAERERIEDREHK
jgi:hypothetical protein